MLEVMVAFAILIVSFIGIMGSFPIALSINKASEGATIASYEAQSKIEELSSLEYDDIATGTIETLHRLSDEQTDNLYYFQRQTVSSNIDSNLNSTTTDTGLKKITTEVYYQDPAIKGQKKSQLNYIISRK